MYFLFRISVDLHISPVPITVSYRNSPLAYMTSIDQLQPLLTKGHHHEQYPKVPTCQQSLPMDITHNLDNSAATPIPAMRRSRQITMMSVSRRRRHRKFYRVCASRTPTAAYRAHRSAAIRVNVVRLLLQVRMNVDMLVPTMMMRRK